MAPSAPAIALALAFGIGSRSGDSFCYVRNVANSAACSRRRPRPTTTVGSKPTTTGLAALGEAGSGGRSDVNHSSRYDDGLGQTAAGAEGTDDEAAEELRRQVFANEKGFLESSAFNPARARAEREEEEAQALAAQWGSTPERAKEVIKRTKEDKDLSFQELEGIAQELNMSDEQQRAFMMQASMKRLSAATALPRRAPPNRVKEAVSERVFASEKGFLKNSAAFKSRLQVGSGVKFDAQGFPVADEDDPVIQAAKKTAKPAGVSGVKGVKFPSLPDCPCCSTPTMEDELSQFGMCSQCKALDISSKAYNGPAVASKYTYDNGDAPFSSSWTVPHFNPNTTPAAKDRPRKASRDPRASPPVSSHTTVSGPASDRTETLRRAGEPAALRKGYSNAVQSNSGGGGGNSSSSSSSGGGGGAPSHAAAAAVAGRTKAAAVGAGPTDATAASSTGDRGAGTVSRTAAAAQRTPAARRAATAPAGSAPAAAAAPPAPAATAATEASNATGVADKVDVSGNASPRSSEQVPASRFTSSSSGAARNGGSAAPTVPPATGRDHAPRGGEGGDAAFRKLRLEVAELRTLLMINRAALARVESMGGGQTAGVAKSDKTDNDDKRRDNALRKLKRDVAELRRELSAVGDKVSDAIETPTPRGSRGGDSEVVQTMKREVTELRSQLENARKETALTRSALRRLQGDVDDLREAKTSR